MNNITFFILSHLQKNAPAHIAEIKLDLLHWDWTEYIVKLKWNNSSLLYVISVFSLCIWQPGGDAAFAGWNYIAFNIYRADGTLCK